MISTLSKVTFTQVGEFNVITHKELASLLREAAELLDQGALGKRPETAVGKAGEPGGYIKVDFDFTVDGEVRSFGIGTK